MNNICQHKKSNRPDLTTMVYNLRDGQYSGVVYLNKYLIDKGTMAQIRKMLMHPATENMRIMPDCHRGSGCCVGYTSQLTNKIVPKFIGGDIGCGMLSYCIPSKYVELGDPINIDLDKVRIGGYSLKELDIEIRRGIPMGACHNNVHKENVTDTMKRKLEPIWDELNNEAYQFASAHFKKFGDKQIFDLLQIIPGNGFLKNLELGSDYKYDLQTLQTLGGGNHFIEFNYVVDNNEPKVFITIHSGSRSIGQKICQYHQTKINDFKYLDRDKLKELEKNYLDNIKVFGSIRQWKK